MNSARHMLRRAASLAIILLCAGACLGQPPEADPAALEKLAADGDVSTLEARLTGRRDADALGLLARAELARTRRSTGAMLRDQAVRRVEDRFRAWIDALDGGARRGGLRERVQLGAARVQLGAAILALRVDAELIDFEASLGRHGDRRALVAGLQAAGGEFNRAAAVITPIVEDIVQREDELLTAGLYEPLRQAHFDGLLNGAWVNHYLGVLEPNDGAARRTLLGAAERSFRDLVNQQPAGATRTMCTLGLAMTLRELGRRDESRAQFGAALQDARGQMLEARVRVENARGLIAWQDFDAARSVLAPIRALDPRTLTGESAAGRVYVQLGHVWDAASFLVEAAALRRAAADQPARVMAARRREDGLARLRRIADWGPPWPAIVRIHAAATVDLNAPLESQTSLDLVFSAQTLLEARRYPEAIERLELATSRGDLDNGAAGDALFELGRAQFQARQEQAAAATFQRLAREHSGHASAQQAAVLSVQLLGRAAERSKSPADYSALADGLSGLLERFPDDKSRDDARWQLPVALQSAGRYAEAAAAFAAVPEDDPRREEALFRALLSRRQSLDASRAAGAASPEDVRAIARDLLAYSDAARTRAAAHVAGEPDPADRERRDATMVFAARARLLAAEAWSLDDADGPTVALESLSLFERDFPESDLTGRALALRIRILRGLQRSAEASALVQQFLRTAKPDQIGPTLASLARGVQEETDRLIAAGDTAAAASLARETLTVFDELERWTRADAARSGQLEHVLATRGEVALLAGDTADVLRIADDLLARSPRNGNYRRLHARALTAQLDSAAWRTDGAAPTSRASAAPRDAALAAAEEAWAPLMSDPAIRSRAPARYWEARWQWLRLHAARGHTEAVRKAIFEESRWHPDLGGPPWRERLEALYLEVGGERALNQEAGERPLSGQGGSGGGKD